MSGTAETPRVRSLLVAAVVATALGVALLTGGGGTFSAWSDSKVVEAGPITSGKLVLQAMEEGSWESDAREGDIADIGAYRIVPGETVEFEQEVAVHAEGDALEYELRADLVVSGNNALAGALRRSTTISVNGEEVTGPLTTSSELETFVVTVTVEFPFDSVEGTTAQSQTIGLDKLTVTATQTAPGAPGERADA